MLCFPDRWSATNPATFSCDNCVEIRLCPMPRISCNSATDNGSAANNNKIRNRVGSASNFNDLSIDAMPKTIYHQITI